MGRESKAYNVCAKLYALFSGVVQDKKNENVVVSTVKILSLVCALFLRIARQILVNVLSEDSVSRVRIRTSNEV